MYIFGFPIADIDGWSDPFSGHTNTPEDEICEACHIYEDAEGNRFIGFDLKLKLDEESMRNILSPFSSDLDVRKVKR